MARFPAILAAVFLLFATGTSGAGEFPRVVFPQGHTLETDASGVLTVSDAWLQLEVRPGLIISAERGTRFSARPVSGASELTDLRIDHGAPTIIDIRSNAVFRIPPGQYRIDTSPNAAVMISAVSGAIPDAVSSPAGNDSLSPGYRLSDSIMIQQQKYLDSLKIDVRDINNVLASIIRSLVPRRP
jgi:hypothetical protein